eukprot:TRINITY_DN216_c0_g1_i1.p1 TRINITY_DN216_c0_g1~~TRINITY_DN216_c0_g1_i1.p1  ORF type:complete len:582 (-),score=213.52 TRINITY_DN216_c0_g1_i1:41-1786(-)
MSSYSSSHSRNSYDESGNGSRSGSAGGGWRSDGRPSSTTTPSRSNGASSSSSSRTPSSSASRSQTDEEVKRKARSSGGMATTTAKPTASTLAPKGRRSTSSSSSSSSRHTNVHPSIRNRLKEPSDFLCQMKFFNHLPDVPFPPKLLDIAVDPLRYVRYKPTSLEKMFKQPHIPDVTLGTPLTLIDPDALNPPTDDNGIPIPVKMAPEDAELFEEYDNPDDAATKFRKGHGFIFLRKMSYLSNDLDGRKLYVRDTKGDEYLEKTKADRYHAKTQDVGVDDAMARIADGFDRAQERPVHCRNPSLEPVEVLDVYPAFTIWGNQYGQVGFDDDPSPGFPHRRHQDELTSRAVIKGFQVESTTQIDPATGGKLKDNFAAYMVPEEIPVEVEVERKVMVKRRKLAEGKKAEGGGDDGDDLFGDDELNNESGNGEEEEEEVEETQVVTEVRHVPDENGNYTWVREYAYEMAPAPDFNTEFVFLMSADKVDYLPLEKKITLRRRKAIGSGNKKRHKIVAPREVTITPRKQSEEEELRREERLSSVVKPEVVKEITDYVQQQQQMEEEEREKEERERAEGGESESVGQE